MSSKSAQHGPLWHLFHRDEQHIDWRVRSRAVYEPEPEAWIGMLARQLQGRKPAQPAPVQRQTGGITPIPRTPRDTGEQPQLDFPIQRENREWADVDTVKKLPLRDLLNLPLPDNALPVQRQSAAPETAIDAPSDVQMTLPYSNRAQEAHQLRVIDLPDWIGGAVRASRPLPAGLGFSDPNLVPDLPTTPQKPDFIENLFLNDAPPPVEVWEEYQPPVLAELPRNALSVSDRVAISNPFEVTPADCTPDLTDEDDPEATRASALLKLRFCEHKKESEEK